jgi:hypothetical protein
MGLSGRGSMFPSLRKSPQARHPRTRIPLPAQISPAACSAHIWRDRSRSGGRTGELNFAIFQGPLSTGGPRRATIEHEISPPPPRRLVVPLQSLQKKANIEHGVSICGIGIKRALQALDRLDDAALVIEDIGEVVPGRCEIRIGPDRYPIGGLRFEAAARPGPRDRSS